MVAGPPVMRMRGRRVARTSTGSARRRANRRSGRGRSWSSGWVVEESGSGLETGLTGVGVGTDVNMEKKVAATVLERRGKDSVRLVGGVIEVSGMVIGVVSSAVEDSAADERQWARRAVMSSISSKEICVTRPASASAEWTSLLTFHVNSLAPRTVRRCRTCLYSYTAVTLVSSQPMSTTSAERSPAATVHRSGFE